MKKQRIYISGKMSGLSREVILYRFTRCELWLRHTTGAEVVNPCNTWAFRWPWIYRLLERLFGKEGAYTLVLLYDLWLLSKCQRLHLIGNDWMTSRGAQTERAFAQQAHIDVTIDLYTKKR